MEIESEVFGEDNALEAELVGLSNDEVRQRIRAFENEVRIMKSDMNRIKHEAKEQMAHVKDNKEKVKMNKVVSANSFHVFSFCFLPLLVWFRCWLSMFVVFIVRFFSPFIQ